MEKTTAQMRSFCEGMLKGQGERKAALKELREESRTLRENARKNLADSKRLHGEMSKELRQQLEDGKRDLKRKVGTFLEDFVKKERGLREDLAEAGRIWKKTQEILRNHKARPAAHQKGAGNFFQDAQK